MNLVRRVGAELAAADVRQDSRVVILGDQQPAAFCALFAVLHSGAIAVPLTTQPP